MITLSTLIDTTTDQSDSQTPLGLLACAAQQRQELTERGDELLDYFVEHARSEGCSWTQIGTVLGVSKQAIQQRHGNRQGMFGRLKETLGGTFNKLLGRLVLPARQSLMLAQEEARQLNHGQIGAEHLLLGVLAHTRNAGAQALAELGVDLDRARATVAQTVGAASGSARRGQRPFTSEAKNVLKLSLTKSAELQSNHIGTEHMLLALTQGDSDGVAHVLEEQGVDIKNLRSLLLRQLSNRGQQ